MNKKFLLVLLCFFSLHAFAEAPYKIPGIAFPLDERTWVLTYPLLPHGQDEIWLMPEKDTQNEFIVVKFYPSECEFDNFNAKKNDPAQSKVYAQKKEKNKAINAIHIKADDKFHINVLIQGKTQLYEVHYVTSGAQISEEERAAWIKRLSQAREALAASGNWIHLIPTEVTQNQAKIKSSNENRVYKHSTQGFSVNLPQPWAVAEDYTPMPEVIDGFSFINQLVFSRGDKLIMGNVAIAESFSGKEFNWTKVMKYLRRDFNLCIVTNGSITTFDGLEGHFIVFKEGNNLLIWKAFYTVQGQTYLVELNIHPNNYTATKKEIFDLLRSFSLKPKNFE